MRNALSLAFVGMGLLHASVAGATVYNESINGDLSGDRANPTVIVPTPGSNTITATSTSGDIEYFRLTIPSGSKLSAINVISSTSASLSFIAVQRGTTFTEPPTGTNVANLLGYTHFGPANGTIGTDILDNLGTGAGAIGFVPPLAAGDYTFWSQETSSTPSTYQLDFVMTSTAAPALPPWGSWLLAAGFLGAGTILVRRRSAARA